ncbi:extracellular solute-binding protein family 1 [Thermobaculum terrenum ATCC BAA-798]|uniref:Extracellular solute-binding protein family 1 n=1 Tax=Thermobaculum terrenum (strain ATCC BAA-798 / CCMEE 7001 / YNP1) TaxID=525904 RepID=D1CHZ6_THET1|nr:sugar ABC transporter substrate-binding protein [Thermobaculum terrenum]ACZ43367.1 extracellular solute-binding protein family 1 [Thermobaculum terrenum ATCC BAA-798]
MQDEGLFQNGAVMSRRQMLRLAAGAAASLALAACGGRQMGPGSAQGTPGASPTQAVVEQPPKEGAITIIATSQMPINTWKTALKEAQERYPDIRLKVTQTSIQGGWSAYADKIITQIAGGEQLDVIMIAIEGLALLSSKRVLRPLDEFIQADSEAYDTLHNDIHKTLREMMQYEGKQMEFPFSWNNMVIYYNTKIFQEEGLKPPSPDWTWNDFLGVCKQVANVRGTAKDRYAYSFWGAGMFGMCAWYFNNDTSSLTDDWQDSNMLDPKVAETLQFLVDLIRKHRVAPNPAGWDENAQFHAGHLVMRTCGRWCIGASLAEKFTSYDLQYQPHKSGPYKTVVGTDGWGIATMSQHPNEAWKAVKVLSGKTASRAMVELGGNIPALRSVAEEPAFREYGPENTEIFYESLDYARTVPSPPNFNIIEPILDRHYSTIWNGQKTVQEAVKLAHQELQAEMDKLKEESRSWRVFAASTTRTCPCQEARAQ